MQKDKTYKQKVSPENNKSQVDIDLALYDKEAITATCYKYTDRFYISQKTIANSIVRVSFESHREEAIKETIIKDFLNELIDQQVRCNVNKQFGYIRDLIVEQAFKPVGIK